VNVFISSHIEGTAGIVDWQQVRPASTWIRGVRTAIRTVTDDDPVRLFRTFVTIISLTRSIVER
jgi:D-aminopeptidase